MAQKKKDSSGLHLELGPFKGTGVGFLGILGLLFAFGIYQLSTLGGLLRLGGAAGSLLLPQ